MMSEKETAYWAAIKAAKLAAKRAALAAAPRVPAPAPSRVQPERRNADGRTARGQRALERCARMVYDHDRDFDYETGGGSEGPRC